MSEHGNNRIPGGRRPTRQAASGRGLRVWRVLALLWLALALMAAVPGNPTPGRSALGAPPAVGAPARAAAGRAIDEDGPSWQQLAPGLEMAEFPLPAAAVHGDGRLTVLRVDPARARLTAIVASERDSLARTAAEWCRQAHLAAAINLGMFQRDRRTHVGYLRTPRGVDNPHWVSSYKSVLAFDPRRPGLPPAVLVDLDDSGAAPRLDDYGTVIQNLRLIRGGRLNVWTDQDQRWSEAAAALDSDGRLLFLFTRTPLPMAELNRAILALPLHIERAMHLEGGPEASLSVHCGPVDLDLVGGFESGFSESDLTDRGCALPNIIGVQMETK